MTPFNEKEIKLLEEDTRDADIEDFLQVQRELEQINNEVTQLRKWMYTLHGITENQDLLSLEEDIYLLQHNVEDAEKELLEAKDNDDKRFKIILSGGLGSFTGGLIGYMLTPFFGVTIPLITTLAGGTTGVIYSYLH
jgi:hypothetical protein